MLTRKTHFDSQEGNTIKRDILIVMSPKEHPEELCAAFNGCQIPTTLVPNVQAAFDSLKLHISTFLLLDFCLDDAASFLKRVTATFYDPPPYVIVADDFSCSMAQADILNLGADAYLGKPLDIREALAVVNAALRRADRLAHPKPLQTALPIERGAMRIDPLRQEVTMNGRLVTLTVKEFGVLQLLIDHPGIIFSKDKIYEQVWGEDPEFATTSVPDLISSLRKKLGLSSKDGSYIQTVYGAGYRFVEPE